MCNNQLCFFHITQSLQRRTPFLWLPASWLSSMGLGTCCGSALCTTFSSPPGSTTALPRLPPLPNVVMATDSQWAQETPCWAKTGRERHWAASVGADEAKVLGQSPLFLKERGKHVLRSYWQWWIYQSRFLTNGKAGRLLTGPGWVICHFLLCMPQSSIMNQHLYLQCQSHNNQKREKN